MEESRNKRLDWEGRLKALLSKFREDNMSDYRMSAEYKDNQEEIQIGYQQLGKLELGKDVMGCNSRFWRRGKCSGNGLYGTGVYSRDL